MKKPHPDYPGMGFFLSIFAVRGQQPAAVRCQQSGKIIHPVAQFIADVCIHDHHAGYLGFKQFRVGFNIDIVLQSGLQTLERLVGNNPHSPGIVNQGIAGNPGRFLIRPAETAVDDNELPSRFDRALPFANLYRYMPVDNVGKFRGQAKFPQDFFTGFLFLI